MLLDFVGWAALLLLVSLNCGMFIALAVCLSCVVLYCRFGVAFLFVGLLV